MGAVGLYENYAQFGAALDSALAQLLPARAVTLRCTRDGSGLGAALLAAAANRHRLQQQDVGDADGNLADHFNT